MKTLSLMLGTILGICTQLSAQLIGGGCDGCEMMFEGMPAALSWQTVIAGKDEPGEPLIMSGKVYKRDGKTPAPDVIVYVYHTDNKGLYSLSAGQTQARRHGHLRGWMKTNAQGQYQFTTIRPAPYPNRQTQAHIHPIIKEPGLNEYYLDEIVFEGDPYLSKEFLEKAEHRGGVGVIRLTKNSAGTWKGTQDIILGLHIPNYPK